MIFIRMIVCLSKGIIVCIWSKMDKPFDMEAPIKRKNVFVRILKHSSLRFYILFVDHVMCRIICKQIAHGMMGLEHSKWVRQRDCRNGGWTYIGKERFLSHWICFYSNLYHVASSAWHWPYLNKLQNLIIGTTRCMIDFCNLCHVNY